MSISVLLRHNTIYLVFPVKDIIYTNLYISSILCPDSVFYTLFYRNIDEAAYN